MICLVTRGAYYRSVFVPGITPDTFTYYLPVFQFNEGQVPLFDLRTAGYPFFLFLAYTFSTSLKGVFIFQSFVSLLLVILCLWNISKLSRFSAALSLSLLLIYGSTEYLIWEVTLNPIMLFTVLLVLYGLFVLRRIETKRAHFFILASIVLAYMLALRPQAAFIVPAHFIFIAHARLKDKLRIRNVLVNITIMIFAISFGPVYNLVTTGKSANRFDMVTQYCLTNSIIFPNRSLPVEINRGIEKSNVMLTQEEKEIIDNSWNPERLITVINVPHYDRGWIITRNIAAEYNVPYNNIQDLGVDFQQLPRKSLMNYPLYYIKYVFANIYGTGKLHVQPERFYMFRVAASFIDYMRLPEKYETQDSVFLQAMLRDYAEYVKHVPVTLPINYFEIKNGMAVYDYIRFPRIVRYQYLLEYYTTLLFYSKPFFVFSLIAMLVFLIKRNCYAWVFAVILLANLGLMAFVVPPLLRFILTSKFFLFAMPYVALQSLWESAKSRKV